GVPEMDGGELYFDNLQLAAVSTSGIADDLTPAAPPLEFALSQNYPNPFNGSTIIPYQLDAEAADVHVAVFNVLGQRIRLYSQSSQLPGHYQIQWDGRDQTGKTVSSGIYYYQLKADQRLLTRKMIYAQ
ncbi:T9SS type A sorting domain-containing protein, partial [bacterium]|nr:T9SS type A sorting domain-containing protein [bacterium]